MQTLRITLNKKLESEAIRYLGYGKHAIDERTKEMIQDSLKELEEISNVRFIYRIFEVSFLENKKENGLRLEALEIHSKNLKKNLQDCPKAILFCITLGTEVDRLIRRYSITDMSRAVVMQACAAAFLEAACDLAQEYMKKELEPGWYFRPRFSPGYGDFSIFHQRDILQMLEVPKKIGVTMTDSYMMTPTKSVTAVIGMSHVKQICHVAGCEQCVKKDCIYRR